MKRCGPVLAAAAVAAAAAHQQQAAAAAAAAASSFEALTFFRLGDFSFLFVATWQ
jgi:hypothetical protein